MKLDNRLLNGKCEISTFKIIEDSQVLVALTHNSNYLEGRDRVD